MFNRGVDNLLRALPEFVDLDRAAVKRLLSRAYLQTMDTAQAASEEQTRTLRRELRRMATALEVHAILNRDVEGETRRACAFVAAESLGLLADAEPNLADADAYFPAFGSRRRYTCVETALLYSISAHDANAQVTARSLSEITTLLPEEDEDLYESDVADQALDAIRAWLLAQPPADSTPPADRDDLRLLVRNRAALWREVSAVVTAHHRWLRMETDESESGAAERLLALADQLAGESAGDYADLAHLMRLLAAACGETALRALRRVPPPAGDDGAFVEYLQRRALARPVLWPSADEYVRRCLPGPSEHAALSVPTGAGKSTVAELAVAQALASGWVLYLAPTRALVTQVQRDLRRALRGANVEVRQFLGGPEFTTAATETLNQDPGRQVLVMTPEKCSLALRQSTRIAADAVAAPPISVVPRTIARSAERRKVSTSHPPGDLVVSQATSSVYSRIGRE
jgi:hypothetical protein